MNFIRATFSNVVVILVASLAGHMLFDKISFGDCISISIFGVLLITLNEIAALYRSSERS